MGRAAEVGADNVTDITIILRDKAAGRRNSAGHVWGDLWLSEAADEIDRLRDALRDYANGSPSPAIAKHVLGLQ